MCLLRCVPYVLTMWSLGESFTVLTDRPAENKHQTRCHESDRIVSGIGCWQFVLLLARFHAPLLATWLDLTNPLKNTTEEYRRHTKNSMNQMDHVILIILILSSIVENTSGGRANEPTNHSFRMASHDVMRLLSRVPTWDNVRAEPCLTLPRQASVPSACCTWPIKSKSWTPGSGRPNTRSNGKLTAERNKRACHAN